MSFKHFIITLITAGLLMGCKRYDDIDDSNSTPPSCNISIQQLRSLVGDKSVTIEQELTIGGYITSSDRAGNFYRTFTFEDLTGGVEVMAGLYDLHNIYPQGYYVSASLKGCTLSLYNGVLQVGRQAKSYSSFPTDYFSSQVLLKEHVTCYDQYHPITPTSTNIESLTAEMCGRLVTISDLQLCSSLYADVWQVNQEGKWSGYNIFCNTDSNIIVVHTSEYANYAGNDIPTQQVALTGILQQAQFDGEECFLIKMRDEKDCSIHN